MTDLKALEEDITATIVEAKDSLSKIEDSTKRLQEIISSHAEPAYYPRTNSRRRTDQIMYKYNLWMLVASIVFVLMCVAGMFYYHDARQDAELAALKDRITRAEIIVSVNHPTISPAIGQPSTITPPPASLHNSD